MKIFSANNLFGQSPIKYIILVTTCLFLNIYCISCRSYGTRDNGESGSQPFSPMTTISYSLPDSSTVSIIVYNAAGQVVDTLIDGFQEAGEYEIEWNPDNARDGVYFYKLKAGEFSVTKKLVLLR